MAGRPAAADPVAGPPPIAAAASPAISTAILSRMISRHWKRIAVIAALATAIAWMLASLQTPRYRASALAAVAPVAESLQPNELLRGVEVLERRTVVATIAALAETPVTRRQVGAGSDYAIRATVMPNTNLFRVEVEGGNAAAATTVANRVPQVLSAQTRAMYKYYGVTMVSPASQPEQPFLPRPARAAAAGLAVGLFLGLLAAYAAQRRAASRAVAS